MVTLESQAWKVAFLSVLIGPAAAAEVSCRNSNLRITGLRILRKATNDGVTSLNGNWQDCGGLYHEDAGKWTKNYCLPVSESSTQYEMRLEWHSDHDEWYAHPAGWYMYSYNATVKTLFAQCRSSKCKAAIDLLDLGNEETWKIVDDDGSLHRNGANVLVGCCPTKDAPCNSCQDSECAPSTPDSCHSGNSCCAWYSSRRRDRETRHECGCIAKQFTCQPYTPENSTEVDLMV